MTKARKKILGKVSVSDYIVSFISDILSVKDVFMVTGAATMHLTDGVARNKKLRAICVHHEQTASMALEAYARANENFGVGIFSTGPGATNAITGLAGAWLDSVPCLFISGQVKSSETSIKAGVDGLRQFGVQELNIVPIVSSLTKYVCHLDDPKMVRFELEKAVAIAKQGRPGPVWLEVPMDIQNAQVDPVGLVSYSADYSTPVINKPDIKTVMGYLKRSKRPVIIAGRGVRLAKAGQLLSEFSTKHQIPVVTPYLGVDNIPHNEKTHIGTTGIKGDRAANLAMQNSDLIIAIGTSLHVSVIGYNYNEFARAAKKIVVDIDLSSHLKKTIKIDHLISSDAAIFLSSLLNLEETQNPVSSRCSQWLDLCVRWKSRYPVCLPEYKEDSKYINIYSFIDRISALSREGDVFVSDAGSAIYAVPQGLNLKQKNQRYLASGGMATMGYSLPAAIGISSAIGDKRVLAITGDGSLQMNIQELQTLVHYQFPVKLFILNNGGYLSIRVTQKNYFSSRLIGEGPQSGVSMPDTRKICEAYGIPVQRVSELSKLDRVIKMALKTSGPFVVDVITPPNQAIIPSVSSQIAQNGQMVSRPLEDMAPFLPREEYEANMLIDRVD